MPIFGTPSPEVWLNKLISNNNLKVNEIEFHIDENYNNNLMNQMGFYHKNAGIRGWRD